MKSNLEDIEVYRHHATELAYKVSLDGDDENAVWIPKSMCELEHVRGRVWLLTAEQDVLEDRGLV